MKCERCGKEDAVVRITRVSPEGHKTTINLGQCDECVSERKYTLGQQPQQPGDEILKEILQQAVTKAKGELAEVPLPDLQCASCGLDFIAYRTTGMLGCPDCYETFQDILVPELQRYHRASSHTITAEDSHREQLAAMAERLAVLRAELRDAVEAEDYSRAAWLRDEAAQIEGRLANKPDPASATSDAP